MTRNPKCNRLASSSKDGTIRIWDTVTRHTSITMSQHISAVTCIRWGGDGLLYSSSRDKTIKIWDTTQVPTIYYLEIINITDIFFLFILTNSLLFIKGKACKNVGRYGHWVNTIALSTDFVLRTGFFDHTGRIPKDENQGMFINIRQFIYLSIYLCICLLMIATFLFFLTLFL